MLVHLFDLLSYVIAKAKWRMSCWDTNRWKTTRFYHEPKDLYRKSHLSPSRGVFFMCRSTHMEPTSAVS